MSHRPKLQQLLKAFYFNVTDTLSQHTHNHSHTAFTRWHVNFAPLSNTSIFQIARSNHFKTNGKDYKSDVSEIVEYIWLSCVVLFCVWSHRCSRAPFATKINHFGLLLKGLEKWGCDHIQKTVWWWKVSISKERRHQKKKKQKPKNPQLKKQLHKSSKCKIQTLSLSLTHTHTYAHICTHTHTL